MWEKKSSYNNSSIRFASINNILGLLCNNGLSHTFSKFELVKFRAPG